VDCLTTSTVLTIAGGACGLFGAGFVVLDVVKERRAADRFRTKMQPVVEKTIRAQPAPAATDKSPEERIAALEVAIQQLEKSVIAAIAGLRKELNVKINQVAETAAADNEKTQNLASATVNFVTGHGFLRRAAALLVVLSIPLATVGGVVANGCASPPHPGGSRPSVHAAHIAYLAQPGDASSRSAR
jgi:hypothetical protein